jgi:hypothetical protein
MPGDLEDFLRRAAQRRQQKAGAAQPPPQRRRPEYTDSRRERVTEPIEVAELVEEPIEADLVDEMGRTLAEQRKRIREAEQRAADIRAQVKKKAGAAKSRTGSRAQTKAGAKPIPTRDDLVYLLTRQGGLQQAILMKEVLDRPEHRW